MKVQAARDRMELEDRMARRIQGFYLRRMYKRSLPGRDRKNLQKQLPDSAFKLTRGRDKFLMHVLYQARPKIVDMSVMRSVVLASRTFGGHLSQLKSI